MIKCRDYGLFWWLAVVMEVHRITLVVVNYDCGVGCCDVKLNSSVVNVGSCGLKW